jgi:hypothetical protein
MIVHGHSPVPEVHFGERRINVDTGCVYEQVLTALELPSKKIYSVQRAKEARHVHLRDFGSNRIAIRFKGAIPVYVHRGTDTLEFETIDYSEFGMLMRHLSADDGTLLSAGQVIDGEIGADTTKLVAFRGHVLRRQDSDEHGPCYAVKLDVVDPTAD